MKRPALWRTPLGKLLLQAEHRLGFANRVRERGARKRSVNICRELRPALRVGRYAREACLGELRRDADIGYRESVAHQPIVGSELTFEIIEQWRQFFVDSPVDHRL